MKFSNLHQHSTFSDGKNTNSFTGAAVRGYQGQKQAQEGEADKQKARVDKAKNEREQQEKELQAQKERKEDVIRNITERVTETLPKDTPMKDIKANVIAQMFGEPSEMAAKVNGQLSTITSTGQSVDVGTATQTIRQVLSEKCDVSPDEVEQVVKQVVTNPDNVTPSEVEQIVNQVIGNKAAADDQTITQVVNQVYGTRVNNAVDDATQKVVQEVEKVNTTVEDATQKVTQEIEQSMDIQRNISDSMEQQVNISREISDDVKVMNTNIEDIHVFTDLTAEYTENIKNNMNNNNP